MTDTESKQKLNAASKSIGANVFLISLKTFAAVITGSIGIIAELIHSSLDFLASILAYLGIKKASEPADKYHHYGHERFETFSALIQTILILVTSAVIIYEAAGRIFHPLEVSMGVIGIIVILITIVVDLLVARYLHRQSKKYGSAALEADAYHFSTDLMTSIAVAIGLIFATLGFPIADALAAMIVSVIMIYIAIKIGKSSTSVLLDESPPEETMNKISEIINMTPEVLGYHSLRARHSGKKYLVDVSVHLRTSISLSEAHRISQKIEERVKKEIPEIREIVVHTEPEEEHE